RKALPLTVKLRRLVGTVILVAGGAVLLHDAWTSLWRSDSAVLDALLGGLFAAFATAAGGVVPLFFARTMSDRTQHFFFGFGAGVMAAASAFSLILPGIDAAQALGDTP